MPLLLYDNPVSGNCWKVRQLLRYLDLPFERRELSVVDRSGRDQIIGDLNPALRVPTIVLEDGRPLAESHAILWYFAEGTPYLPDDAYARAQVLQWLCFEQYEHEPAIAVARFQVAISDEPRDPAAVEERLAAGRKALVTMERHLAGRAFLVGDALTIADLALYAYTHVAHEAGLDLAGLPEVRAWLDRVTAVPGLVPLPDG
ncbi:glutathione S-transferase family protein [Patulibacter minatonensis]|uniref:glutathione S-transferase family protein n=1 Tax=Patulibacter minatonensis TaxID=298163 RepID=UPI000478E038|nr:glutathione S-transferase family protein [Patulibacter minatonensis]